MPSSAHANIHMAAEIPDREVLDEAAEKAMSPGAEINIC